MEKWVCVPCGYVYDPEIGDPDRGVAPGTSFENIPDDWVCPVCGVDKSSFELEYTKYLSKRGFNRIKSFDTIRSGRCHVISLLRFGARSGRSVAILPLCGLGGIITIFSVYYGVFTILAFGSTTIR